MEYNDALEKIHSFEKFGVNPGLSRIKRLLDLMGNPQEKVRYVHVAGTNGKGSICTMLSSVMKECGYKTGLYTSPAIVDFRERIQINGEMIKKNSLINITQRIISILDNIGDEDFKLTEFELVTAIAFEYFFEEKCDIVILETGLGGRLDATNIIKSPVLSVIASISFDHMKILGNTLQKIAFEKSGIIKENCSVVVYPEQNTSVMSVIKEQASLKKSPLFIADKSVIHQVYSDLFLGTKFIYNGKIYEMSFVGEHQINNLATVLMSLKIIGKEFCINSRFLFAGIKKAKIPARLEVLSKNPTVLLDGAHNVSSIEALYDVLVNYFPKKNLIAIVGMLADKDVETSFSKILPIFKRVNIVKPSNNRAMSLDTACSIAEKYNNNVFIQYELEDIIKLEFNKLKNDDVLVIFGSLYLASDVKRIFLKIY